MRAFILAIFWGLGSLAFAESPQTIHVFVALCDNANQGIVPVPASLGNGQDPKSNLYWGAAYGVKSYFRYKTSDWQLVKSLKAENENILERVLFKHRSKDVYLLADAYDGATIKDCTIDFLKATNGQDIQALSYEGQALHFGGGAALLAYVGHDGLMEFQVNVKCQQIAENKRQAIILACYSKDYFAPHLRQTGAQPLLGTTHLMAPEAYTLKAAIDGWLQKETGAQIDERAAQAYNRYQKCGLRGARNLFTTGY